MVDLGQSAATSKMSSEIVKLSQSEMDEKVKEFREWIKQEPDLPQNLGMESH
jgi:hypothetical protein